MNRLCLILLLLGSCWPGLGQECRAPMLISPANGATGVALDTAIEWQAVEGVPGYLLSLGTTPGGTELVNRQQMGSATSYTPPTGLPESTRIYVTVTLYFFETGVPDVPCTSESFTTRAISEPPGCSELSVPEPGSTGVSTKSLLRWDYVAGAASYRLRVGTSEGAADLYEVEVTDRLTFIPPEDLPEEQQIYVSVLPSNRFGDAQGCTDFSFTTGALGQVPGCTRLIAPLDGATDVDLNPELQWEEVAGATGYRVTIGNSPFSSEILNGAEFSTNTTRVIAFEPNRSFFIRIVPFNEAGEALDCVQESFSTLLGCGPYFDASTGELVDHYPVTSVPDTLQLCATGTYRSPDEADGYRWYRITGTGELELIAESREIAFESEGEYLYEAYNLPENGPECPVTQLITVNPTTAPAELTAELEFSQGQLYIEAVATGNGSYEYSLSGEAGSWQEEGSFGPLEIGDYTVYARDLGGCGILQRSISGNLLQAGFPKFFSPNGDDVNEYWQYRALPSGKALPIDRIEVYDRYGRYLAGFSPLQAGWDGTLNGNPLPASNYWYRATTSEGQVLTGYFVLKR